MIRWTWLIAMAALLSGVRPPSTAVAITIDDFTVGAIVVDGPNGVASQTGLDPAHVVGGNREIRVERTGNRIQVETLKSRLHVTTTNADLGYFQVMYGLNEPLNVDFTAGGHDRIRFRFVDGTASGILWTYVNSALPPNSNGVGIGSGAMAIQGSGVVEVPFSTYHTDFTNVTSFAIWDTRMSLSRAYRLEEIVTAGPPLPGDYNRDGSVDTSDYNEWRRMVGKSVSGGILLGADGNEDGVVDAADYTIWRDGLTLAAGAGGSDAGVPEPAAGGLAMFALMWILGRRIRRNPGGG